MSRSNQIIETFSHDSAFITEDIRKDRWAIPYHYEALNGRVENLLYKNKEAIQGKKILDLGCHFGTFAYASLLHGAASVTGVDSETELINQAHVFFEQHVVQKNVYDFIEGDVSDYLAATKDKSFDTILCLGIFYYLNDPFHILKEMQRVATKYIILDTFTAYYGACVSKEGENICKSTNDETFDLPMILCPFTKATKKGYTLKSHFQKGAKLISIISLPTIPALENFFDLLGLKYTLLSWEKYNVYNNYTWKDFVSYDVKVNSHWADIYHTKIRVSYVLEID